ncbi:MAG: cytochrome c oxidase assembly protein [Gallionella sp.]
MNEKLERANKRLVLKLAMLAVTASFLGVALVPFYNWICVVSGLNGKTGGAVESSDLPAQADTTRWVTVEFMGNVMPGMNLDFHAKQNKIKVHPGEVVTVDYVVKNATKEVLNGQAVPSVSPGISAKYFKKIDCFCFKQQQLQAGETRDMPLVFFVSPELPQDIRTITLSYAFYLAVDGHKGYRADKVLGGDL